jgi:glycosyltransferase involved in cell wall biosynthesis
MRLGIVSPFPPEISGVGQYGARLAAGLAESRRFSAVRVFGHQAANAPQFEEREGLSIERVWQRDSALAAPRLLRALNAWQPDVIWFNLGLTVFGRSRIHNFQGLLSPMLMALRGLPTVVTLHEIFEAANLRALGTVNGRITHWGGAVAMRALLQADAVCLTLRSYTQVMRERYKARNIFHMPHGAFDAPAFVELPADKRILIFGTFAPYKGLNTLIEIYRQLREADPALKLTIAGSDHPRFPGYLAAMRAETGDLPGLEWRLGVPEADLPALFQSAWVVALPYTATTGASSVAHRAATHGRPVVAYALPDLQEMAQDEHLYLNFVPAGDKEAFARQLNLLLASRQWCEQIGRANVASIQKHTLEVTCRRYIELFEAAAERRAVRGLVPADRRLPSSEA